MYEYALTEEGGLVKDNVFSNGTAVAEGRFWAAGDQATMGEANQLKYVCRQLYQETKGLGIRLNDLTFRSSYGASASSLFRHFLLYECTLNCHAHIKSVIVEETVYFTHDTPNPFLSTWRQEHIRRFLEVSPCASITVNLRFVNSMMDARWFWVVVASAIHRMIRGEFPGALRPNTAEHHLASSVFLRMSVQNKTQSDGFPTNIHFFPREVPVRANCMNMNGRIPGAANIEEWNAQTKEWQVEGF